MDKLYQDQDTVALNLADELWHVGPAPQAYKTDGRLSCLLSRCSIRRVRRRRSQGAASGVIPSSRVMAVRAL
ncbi:hypothetical protein [Candidatus Nitronereus thalassa]|uniref:Uncharacterized protein n=1 Tax=Candidatus Nitronereus thalassa TaxID=3020898 RepID=A0ABU3K495_9BACT|nr:hypothetical protein [Candidatus Nitronereus thalassa]MDT7041195.1 hypothetical protein [Candidatus Nitronereus thalassa]